MIVGGTITNDVGTVLRSADESGEDYGGGEGEEGIGTLAGVHAHICALDIACTGGPELVFCDLEHE